jgi:peptidoglycan LD-endopeptidase CwlK
MPHYGAKSEIYLLTCHPDIQQVFRRVIQVFDHSVLCGHRGDTRQEELYAQGRTTPGKIVTSKRWPDSKHNEEPSLAIDVAPYPIDWDDVERFAELAGHVLQVADLFNIQLTWGGHWKRKDRPHFQLRRKQ